MLKVIWTEKQPTTSGWYWIPKQKRPTTDGGNMKGDKL